jgi:hypothetical protein
VRTNCRPFVHIDPHLSKRIKIDEGELLATAQVAFDAAFKAAEKFEIKAITKQFTGTKNLKNQQVSQEFFF